MTADEFVTVNGARVHVQVQGTGPPVVLLHAGIADLRMWDLFAATFSSSHRVIRYDLRGFGRSTMPEGLYSHVEDLHALVDSLGVGRAHMVGISYGGRIAMEFAIRYPLRVAGLVLVAPGLGGFDWTAQMLDYGTRSDDLAQRGDLEGLVALDLATWLAGPKRKLDALDPGLVAQLAEMIRGANARWAEQARGTAQWLDPPAATRLQALRAPTLVMVGDADLPDMLAIADLIEKRVKGARKVVFGGVAHMLPLERPDEFYRMVARFLSESDALPTLRGGH